MSPSGTDGKVGAGRPLGSAPTVFTPSAARSKTAVTTMAATTATSTAGIFVVMRGRASRSTRVARPTASAVVFV